MEPDSAKACVEIVEKIKSGKIATRAELEREKISISRKYSLGKLLKNSELISAADDAAVAKFLKTKPVRTLSGVANIAVMWLGDVAGDVNFSCPFHCVFCPQGKHAISDTIVSVPKSYTGTEPTTMRAMRNRFDPCMQVRSRLKQFHLLGHKTDKCELIIMGGTFMAWSKQKRDDFILQCFNAFNQREADSIEESHMINEGAQRRVVGLTIETRADYCSDSQIKEMLSYGCTRAEVGVQSTSELLLERMKRGHGAEANKEAFAKLREAGLKVCAHWMPGLTGLVKKDMDQEIESFAELFDDPAYRPDELKIYPTLVVPGTELHEMWSSGKYEPLTYEEGTELLARIKVIVPPYVRIKRIMRDISEHEAVAGARKTNLRQLLREEMTRKGLQCRCIRCREVGLSRKKAGNAEMLAKKYEASSGIEHFLSFEDVKNDLLVAFLRLRIDQSDAAKIRELHVYGQMVPLDDGASPADFQHRGFGKALMQKAEEIAEESGKKSVHVTSGVGVRGYYKKLGYSPQHHYMVKNLDETKL
ncbi:MAG: tRNA uridine(34) 5-carboxymethylaminomethyl modification radical SAM/GNAT enzyme Elp3 [Candidatus Aenigmarchaeota archaeon]|nr:tRNA uridine(34) 5-carboxymethylaminomethyl modification radical SAM/GNAT enzyme Elp3 [Candidatus Aenigmarchaeota archaeon]